MLIPRFYLVVYETTHSIHQRAVITLHLAITGRPIRGGTRLVDLQKLTNFLEQFALEVPALISEDLKVIPKPNEKKSLIAARAVHHHEYVFIPRFSARERP